MDYIGLIGGGLWTYIVPFLVVLTIVVFIHELGHFLAARACGIDVSAFSIGFGPELIGWNDRRGTRWKVCALPLGGYVKFVDDENAASMPDRAALDALTPEERGRTFQGKPVWQRAIVVAAGPLANFILSIAIFAAVYAGEGRRVLLPYVAEVIPNSAAEAAGIKAGDRIVSVDGQPVAYFDEIVRRVVGSAGQVMTIGLERGGETLQVTLTPRQSAEQTSLGVQRRGLIGIRGAPDKVETLSYTPLEAVGEAAKQNWLIAEQTFGFFGRLFTGRENIDQISGLGRIAQASGETAKLGLVSLIVWTAFISTSIGILNLLPIPVLDGGHLVFYAIEALRGRPVPERAQEYGFRIGLALVLMLMIVANGNDVMHFFRLAVPGG
jgi:regulator of sigma E protease